LEQDFATMHLYSFKAQSNNHCEPDISEYLESGVFNVQKFLIFMHYQPPDSIYGIWSRMFRQLRRINYDLALLQPIWDRLSRQVHLEALIQQPIYSVGLEDNGVRLQDSNWIMNRRGDQIREEYFLAGLNFQAQSAPELHCRVQDYMDDGYFDCKSFLLFLKYLPPDQVYFVFRSVMIQLEDLNYDFDLLTELFEWNSRNLHLAQLIETGAIVPGLVDRGLRLEHVRDHLTPRGDRVLPHIHRVNIDRYFRFNAQSLSFKNYTNFERTGRLNIEYMISYLITLNKGEQHKFIKHMFKDVNNWKKTVETNSTKSVLRLIKICKYLNVDCSSLSSLDLRQKYRAQMFSVLNDISSLAGSAKRIEGAVDSNLPDVMESLKDFSGVMGDFSAVINKIKNMYTGNTWMINLATLINKVYLVFAVVYRKCSYDIIASAIFNMVEGLVPTTCISHFLEVIKNSLFRASEGVLNFNAQSEENDTSFLQAVFNSVGQAFTGLFNPMSKNDFHDFSINVKKVTALSTLLRACKSLMDYALLCIEFVMKHLIKFITNKVSFIPRSFVPSHLETIYNELDIIEKEDIHIKAQSSFNSARRIIAFRDNLNLYLKTGDDSETSKLMLMHLNYIKREAEDWVKKIPPYLRDVPGSDREKPIWIYIYGLPRIGKTTIVGKTLVYKCAQKMKLIDKGEKWDAFVYMRELGAEFWEGYNGQPVVCYTDIFQAIKDERKMDLSITELTRVNDGNALGLNMAFPGPKGKGNNFFTSKLIISDAQGEMNISPFGDRCWSSGTHAMARRTFVLELVLNPKYADDKVGIDFAKYRAEFDQGNYIYTRENPICPNDAYIFKLRHNTEGTVWYESTDFAVATDYIAALSLEIYGKESKFNKAVEDFCASTFAKEFDACTILAKTQMNVPENIESDYGSAPSSPPNYRHRQRPPSNLPDCSMHPLEDVAMFFYNENSKFNNDQSNLQQEMDSMFREANCTCFSRQAVNILKIIHFYPKTHDVCFATEAEVHEYYAGGVVKRVKSTLRVFLDMFYEKIVAFKNFMLDCAKSAATKMVKWISDNPVYGFMSIYCSVLGMFLVKDWYKEQGLWNPIFHPDANVRVKKGVKGAARLLGKRVEEVTYYEFLDYMEGKVKQAGMKDSRKVVSDAIATKNTGLDLMTFLKNNTKLGHPFCENAKVFGDSVACDKSTVGCEEHNTIYFPVNFKKTGWSDSTPYFELDDNTLEDSDLDDASPQSHEHKERKKIVTRRRRTNKKAQSLSVNTADMVLSSRSNFCQLLISYEENGSRITLASNSGLNFVADLFVMPRHYWLRCLEYANSKINAKLTLYWPTKKEPRFTTVDPLIIKLFPDELSWKHAEDLQYMQIKNVCNGKNIIKKFSSINSKPNLARCNLVGIRSIIHRCTETCIVHFSTNYCKIESIPVSCAKYVSTDESFEPDIVIQKPVSYEFGGVRDLRRGVFFPDQTIEVAQFITYKNCPTVGGDCGSILAHEDPSVVAPFIGMHGAADEERQHGIASPIFREDLEEVFAYFNPIVKLDDEVYVVPENPVTGLGAAAQCLDFTGLGRVGNFVRNNKIMSYKVNLPNRTRISKSVVFDLMAEDFGPNLTMPAKLNKETIDGVEYSPILLGIQKTIKDSDMIPKRKMQIIQDHINSSIMSWDSKWLYSEKRILSIDEALNGIDGMKQIDITTSAGFPFVKLAKVTNKTPWLDIEVLPNLSKVLKAKDTLRRMVEYRIECAKRNQIPPTYFVDTLKDECRPIEKVKAFKTRVFQVGPLDLSIVMRQYFGMFFAHCSTTFVEGEMGIGINPDSIEWTNLIKRMLVVGLDFILGDYKDYDGGANIQDAIACAKAANAFYNDGPINAKIRYVIAITVVSAYHFLDSYVYLTTSNKSGHPGTTPFNNIRNMKYFRYVYLETVANDLVDYHKNVSASFTGDDNFAAVSRRVREKFNMFSMRDILAKINITYTAADKGEISLPYVGLEDVTYLKRNFIKHNKFNIYLAPIAMDTITEVARWSESDPLNVEDQLSRFNQTLLFAAPHGEVVFEKFRKKFVEYCYLLKQGNCEVDGEQIYLDFDATKLFTYEKCMGLFYPDYFKPYPDLTGVLKRTHEVLLYMGSDL